jgi:prophage antirepressor-like protein
MQLGIFKYDEGNSHLAQVRTVEIEGQIWFVGSDVAKTLGYAKPSNAINTL